MTITKPSDTKLFYTEESQVNFNGDHHYAHLIKL